MTVEPKRASDRAYAALRREILELELAPGEVIGEAQTAMRLGVSRTPLREAIARLFADGLLVQEGVRGVAVAPISAQDVRELTELREALDAQAARLAALRRDPTPFEELAKNFAALHEALPSREGHGADRDATYELAASLDRAIDEAAANPALTAALASVRLRLARVRRLAQDRPARLHEAAGEHRAIAEAIAWGDPELAANAVRVHLRRSLQHAVARLEDQAQDQDQAQAQTQDPHHTPHHEAPAREARGTRGNRKESA